MKNVKVGDIIYVVERDEDEVAYDICGHMYLATCKHTVLASTTSINGSSDIRDILNYLLEETNARYDSSVSVFRLKDCFTSKKEAERVLGVVSYD